MYLGLIKDGKAPAGCTVLFHLIMFVDHHEARIIYVFLIRLVTVLEIK